MTLDDFDEDSCLIYGIGNVGRQDDGLGWAFVDWLQTQGLCSSADMHKNYQLLLEDAELISNKERVLFIDATKDASVESFTFERAAPRMDFSFTSHAISIPAIMATCQQCFGRLPVVHVLAIRGYEFELEMGLTRAAQHNLEDATAYLSSPNELGQQRRICQGDGAAGTYPPTWMASNTLRGKGGRALTVAADFVGLGGLLDNAVCMASDREALSCQNCREDNGW